MKNYNTPAIYLAIIMVLFGIHFLLNKRFQYLTFQKYVEKAVVTVEVYSDENQNLISELLIEVNNEIEKNNIDLLVRLDSISGSVVMYQNGINTEYFVDWCIYVSNQAITKIRNNGNSAGGISSTIYVFKQTAIPY